MPRIQPYTPATPAKIALVGEAPGKDEELLGQPFVGVSGQELNRMLAEAGIDHRKCYKTNVFLDRPPNNKLEAWCDKKREVSDAYKIIRPTLVADYPDFKWPDKYEFDKLKQGKYIHPSRLFELPRLKAELEAVQPNLIIALGGTACWALFAQSGIEKVRGATTEAHLVHRLDNSGIKVLPTYHPAYILRNWSDRVVCLADFGKAVREAEFPEVRRPRRFVHVAETVKDCWDFFTTYAINATHLAVDVETRNQQITSICFAPTPEVVLVIPITRGPKSKESYWSTVDEITVVRFIKKVLQGPQVKVFQNGMYDLQYIIRNWRFFPVNCTSDTMLAHHALQPELPKGLGFFGSIYTDEASWKLMRKRSKDAVEKKDE